MDPTGETDPTLTITRRNLPHWQREGALYLVTFRLGDSVPSATLVRWRTEQAVWLEVNPEPHNQARLIEKERLFSVRREEFLDAGRGGCLLSDERVATVVENSLRHFDGMRYSLGAWVIMPNHVHVLVAPKGHRTLRSILHSWKSFSAKAINKLMGRSGSLWQEESYDHIVRSDAQQRHYEGYIEDNPRKAGLSRGFRVGVGSLGRLSQ